MATLVDNHNINNNRDELRTILSYMLPKPSSDQAMPHQLFRSRNNDNTFCDIKNDKNRPTHGRRDPQSTKKEQTLLPHQLVGSCKNNDIMLPHQRCGSFKKDIKLPHEFGCNNKDQELDDKKIYAPAKINSTAKIDDEKLVSGSNRFTISIKLNVTQEDLSKDIEFHGNVGGTSFELSVRTNV